MAKGSPDIKETVTKSDKDKDQDKDKKVTPNLKLGGADLGKVKTERILID